MASRLISPISTAEFAIMMREVIPLPGWSDTLVVGNSGGPDSTCLLFLLHHYIKNQSTTNNGPKNLVSISIDHDLQASSGTMAEHAARSAGLLNIKHITAKLPWGQGNYSLRPGMYDKIEEKAREMRQLVLFEQMKKLGANAIAFGHHADDQVETMLMRLGRGSSTQGLAGMRPCRRWGMGSRESYAKAFAIEGMRKWIVRPLLRVEKDRILSTCEEHNLEYVTDPTNFQPQLTIRNAIRHIIKKGGLSEVSSKSFPPNISDCLTDIQAAGAEFDLDSSAQVLRSTTRYMQITRLALDETVDKLLIKYRIPSPPGTFMISPAALTAIGDQNILEALLFRVTRYVSPEPWGHPRAELGRRKASIKRLVTWLSNVELSTSTKSVCVGSGVWWRLTATLGDKLSFGIKNADPSHLAWIAARQPPERLKHKGSGHDVHNLRSLDATNGIVDRSLSWKTGDESPILEVLYDHRFLICFHMDKIPPVVSKSLSNAKILVKTSRPWDIPQVFHEEYDLSTLIHSEVMTDTFVHQLPLGGRKLHRIDSGWVTIHYYRPLSYI